MPATLQPEALATIATPIGDLIIGATDAGLSRLAFADRAASARAMRSSESPTPDAASHLADAERQLAEYFAATRTTFSLPLDLDATEFEQRVYDALTQIPCGTTINYAQLAESAGSPAAYQAVGQANARNPIAIVVPCHRVIDSQGDLAGYAGGTSRKLALLRHEAAITGISPLAIS